MSLFELACQTPGCADFIRMCTTSGYDVNKFNSIYEKAPINFVVESFDPDNLEALLLNQCVNVNFKYSGLTPINFLAIKITNDTFSSIFKCIHLLINYGADLNEPSFRDIVPINSVLKNNSLNYTNKESLVLFMIQRGRDLDRFTP